MSKREPKNSLGVGEALCHLSKSWLNYRDSKKLSFVVIWSFFLMVLLKIFFVSAVDSLCKLNSLFGY